MCIAQQNSIVKKRQTVIQWFTLKMLSCLYVSPIEVLAKGARTHCVYFTSGQHFIDSFRYVSCFNEALMAGVCVSK